MEVVVRCFPNISTSGFGDEAGEGGILVGPVFVIRCFWALPDEAKEDGFGFGLVEFP